MFDPTAALRLDDAALELRDHLERTPPALPCKYFYDQRGSELFE